VREVIVVIELIKLLLLKQLFKHQPFGIIFKSTISFHVVHVSSRPRLWETYQHRGPGVSDSEETELLKGSGNSMEYTYFILSSSLIDANDDATIINHRLVTRGAFEIKQIATIA